MNKFLAGLTGGSGITALVAAGAVILAGVGWLLFKQDTPPTDTPTIVVAPAENAPAKDSSAPPLKAPVEEQPAEVVQTTEDAPQTEATVISQIKPTFDEVRREPDGMTVIAGRAAPEANVQILQNGIEIASVKADGRGQFATLALIAPDGKGHVLSLLQTLGDVQVASADEIILAPMNPPVEIAEATTEEMAPGDASGVDVAAAEALSPEMENDAETSGQALGEPEISTVTPEIEESAQDISPRVAENGLTDAETPVAQTPVSKKVIEHVEKPLTEVNISTEAAATPDAKTTATRLADAAASPEPEGDSEPQLPAPEQSEADPSEPIQAAVAVPAPQSPGPIAVLKSTAEGVELLSPVRPQVMDNVALDTISYSEAGDVQLSGRAQSNTRAVRVYLDNTAIVALDVGPDGRWRGNLPNVDEGVYTLRVDEIAENGQITSRVETPFKREAPAVLAAASAAQDGPLKAITVQKGATLWAIARDRYGKGELYVRVFEANRDSIRDADLIYPGQVFDLPE